LSTLTKILIVILTLSSIFLCGTAEKVLEPDRQQLQELIENLPPGKMNRSSEPLGDPNNGMPADGLTKLEAITKTAREYYTAVINKNWDYVAKLRPLYSADFWKNKYSENPVVELVDVGKPYEPKIYCSGLLVPCIIKLADGKTVETRLVVNYRIINEKPSCVIPATWGKTRAIEGDEPDLAR